MQSPVSDSRFAFAVCNVGSESWLVREVARIAPGTVPSYRRKGLLTFKLDPAHTEHALGETVFARVIGRSLGLARDGDAVHAAIEGERGSPRLHVYARDASADGPDPAWVERARTIDEELREKRRFLEGPVAEDGERVIDVIVAGDEPLLVAAHTHHEGWRTPGGRIGIEVPEDAPSRAFVKLEEALAWSGLTLEVGELAVELGSAPGGAAYALARRGVSVLGVDPAAMDARVLAYEGPGGARVKHLATKVSALRRPQVPKDATLLVCDVNIAPPVVLRSVTSVVSWLSGSLRAAILTLKMNDHHMVDAIPMLLARVRELGFDVRATQLPSNRREICVVARRR